jgi:Fur family ferric uptake transcriptional regulator
VSHHPLADLVEAGTRLTAQRQLIWNVLHRTGDHLTAEGIRARLAGHLPGINLPTIYRTLVFLRNAGLVQEVRVGDGPVRYEAASADERHPHLVCRECDRIEHVEAAELGSSLATAAAERGYADCDLDIVVYGTCGPCAAGARAAAGGQP